MNAVRRLLNDTDTNQPAIQDHMLRELVIAEFIQVSHEAGWDPRTPTRPTTGTSILSYTLAAGDYQTTLEGENDVVATSEVTIDRSREPLIFRPRRELERWINHDVKTRGAIQEGIPRYWTIELLQSNVGAATGEMKNRLWVYPAANEATVVYWPRTLVDTENVDPSSGLGRMPFSYQLIYALEYKVGSLCCDAMSDESAQRLQLDRRSLSQKLWRGYEAALKREKEERGLHVLTGQVEEYEA